MRRHVSPPRTIVTRSLRLHLQDERRARNEETERANRLQRENDELRSEMWALIVKTKEADAKRYEGLERAVEEARQLRSQVRLRDQSLTTAERAKQKLREERDNAEEGQRRAELHAEALDRDLAEVMKREEALKTEVSMLQRVREGLNNALGGARDEIAGCHTVIERLREQVRGQR